MTAGSLHYAAHCPSCRTSIRYKWELYKVNDDFSDPNDLAAREPKKLRELQDLFWAEASKYITIAPRVDFKERTLKATRPDSPISDPSDRESFSPRRRR